VTNYHNPVSYGLASSVQETAARSS